MPNTMSCNALPQPDPLSAVASAFVSAAAVGAAAASSAVRFRRSTSQADSRSIAVSYFAPTGERGTDRGAFCVGNRANARHGGTIDVRCTGIGTPLSISMETSASPTPSWRKCCGDIADFRIGSERFGGGLDRFLIARRECAQRMLDAVAELAENRLGNVVGMCERDPPTPFERIGRPFWSRSPANADALSCLQRLARYRHGGETGQCLGPEEKGD